MLSAAQSRFVLLTAAACLIVRMTPAASAEAGAGQILEEPPHYGLYFDKYEPSFYTGFAPRAADPGLLHIHLGRGDQMRVTLVLSDAVLRDYARDLRERDRTYRALIDSGRLVLTQNTGFADFDHALEQAQVDRLVSEEATLPPEAVRARNLELLERLNPGRVFRIRIPVDELVRRWTSAVRPADHVRMDSARQLELINAMLPTRLFVAELDRDTSAQLEALVRACPEQPASPAALEALRPAFLRLFERASHGVYPIRDGAVSFAEFTAIYPVGTFNQYTSLHNRQIPEYPTPGRRALTTHQRTETIDHVPTDEIYSYSPWLPYMHVGTRLHNAIHTLFWRMRPADTSFLPPAWRSTTNADGAPRQYLWLLSRGPMSHGCTHVNAGHIAELRQLLPADGNRLGEVDVFYNTSALYDVFDIDGDLQPEVIGVRYFIAYSLKDEKPDRLRVRNERHAYYEWLYAGELQYDAADRGVFPRANDCRFIERSAQPGAEYSDIALYEAAYEPEKIQFYRLVDIPFAKALRQVSVGHPFPGLEAQAAAR